MVDMDTGTADTGMADTGTPMAPGVEAWTLTWEVCVSNEALKKELHEKEVVARQNANVFFLFFKVFTSMSWLTRWAAWVWSSPPSSSVSSAGWSPTPFARSSSPRSFSSASSLCWRTPVRFFCYELPQKMRRTWTVRWKRWVAHDKDKVTANLTVLSAVCLLQGIFRCHRWMTFRRKHQKRKQWQYKICITKKVILTQPKLKTSTNLSWCQLS